MSTAKTVKVKNTEDLRLALGAGYEASQIEMDHSEAVTAATAGMHSAEDLANARSEATKAERQRLDALQALAEPGFEKELKAAIEQGATPEAFALTLLKAQKDRGGTLGAHRRDASKSAPHAPPSNDNPPPVGSGASWDRFNPTASSPKRM